MQDAADHSPIVHPILAAHVGRQVRLDPLPLFIVEPVQIRPHHLCSRLTAENQQPILFATKLLGFDPSITVAFSCGF